MLYVSAAGEVQEPPVLRGEGPGHGRGEGPSTPPWQ